MTATPVVPAPVPAAGRRTIGGALSGRDNALNFVRLVLATTVIVGHAWPIGGFGPHPGVGDAPIGEIAVAGFFAASGYLIAGSRDRLGFAPYLWRRALRIYPAFWVALLFVAFVAAPLSTLAHGFWTPTAAAQYVFGNASLWITDFGVDGTLTDVPFPDAWNGSLWTLFYEFAAYLAVGVLFFVKPLRRPVPLAVLTVGAMVGQALAEGPLNISTNLILNALWLGSFFLAGAFLWSVSDRLPAAWWLVVPASAWLGVALWLDMFTVLAPLPFAYVVLWAGTVLPVRLGSVNDISYGVYIYAFPVQQLLSVFGVAAALGPVGAALAAFALTVPLAWLSWVLVERPSMNLRRLVR